MSYKYLCAVLLTICVSAGLVAQDPHVELCQAARNGDVARCVLLLSAHSDLRSQVSAKGVQINVTLAHALFDLEKADKQATLVVTKDVDDLPSGYCSDPN